MIRMMRLWPLHLVQFEMSVRRTQFYEPIKRKWCADKLRRLLNVNRLPDSVRVVIHHYFQSEACFRFSLWSLLVEALKATWCFWNHRWAESFWIFARFCCSWFGSTTWGAQLPIFLSAWWVDIESLWCRCWHAAGRFGCMSMWRWAQIGLMVCIFLILFDCFFLNTPLKSFNFTVNI